MARRRSRTAGCGFFGDASNDAECPCTSRVPDPKVPGLCLHVDTTRTDHHLNNPSHPTPRARDLRERLDSAADEGLSQNIARFLRFLGHQDGDMIELQTLGVPNKYAPTNHFTHVKTVEKAVDALEYADEREPTGSYAIFNAVDPAVATRAASGSWHVAKRRESTTDRDVRVRRALYIDVDAERTSGTSATDEELGHAVDA
jgi:hypothetical protein